MRGLEHLHRASGLKIKAVAVAEGQMHIHITSDGVTAAAPNRPGHRHVLPKGGSTQPRIERWSPVAAASR